MRRLISLLLIAVSLPAAAADWGHYVNERFGQEVDVPPGFVAEPAPENGDGLGFKTPTAELRVYGELLDGDFEHEVAQLQQFKRDDGWTVTYSASSPSWASFSGKMGGRIFYLRAIPMCRGQILGAFEIEYSVADLNKMNPIVDRLVRSLKDSGSGWQC